MQLEVIELRLDTMTIETQALSDTPVVESFGTRSVTKEVCKSGNRCIILSTLPFSIIYNVACWNTNLSNQTKAQGQILIGLEHRICKGSCRNSFLTVSYEDLQ